MKDLKRQLLKMIDAEIEEHIEEMKKLDRQYIEKRVRIRQLKAAKAQIEQEYEE